MPARPKKSDDYSGRRDREGVRSRETSESGRDIGPLPKVKNRRRRKRCEASLLAFLDAYFPETFALPWSQDHRDVIADAERCVVAGGLNAVAMPRGQGKTSVAVRAAAWAILTGRRRFVVMIAAESELAADLIAVLRSELQFNDRLAADFPEVCYPIRRLDNITKRQAGQTLGGKPTMMRLTDGEMVLPTVAGSKCSGSVVRAKGLTASLRGQIATTAEGATIRPDLVLIDDAQTRESAKSPTQNAYREALINGDVLGLAGPTKKIACLNLCTVIYPNDLSDRLLDREKNPAWNGRRTQLLPSLPSDRDSWDQYAEARRASLREFGDNRLGNAMYAANRQAMDAGAVASWKERFDPDELSAVQNAMNFKIDRPRAFAAEGQNAPEAEALGAVEDLTAAALTGRRNRVPRGTVPRDCNRLTAFVDVGDHVLWWAVCGWNEKFGGGVVDYGCWPRQNRAFFAASDARPTLADAYPGVPLEARIFQGLADVTAAIVGRAWPQEETAAELRVERCLVDSGDSTETVYRFCRRAAYAALLLPSKGFAPGAAGNSIDAWAARPNERRGSSWRLSAPAGPSGRLLTFDPDFWKSFVASRLLTPEGSRGAVLLPGDAADDHEMLVDHLTCEYRTRYTARGRTADLWRTRPDRVDNHLFDCVVGCAVAASERGLSVLTDAAAEPPRPAGKPRMKLSEIQAAKRNNTGGR